MSDIMVIQITLIDKTYYEVISLENLIESKQISSIKPIREIVYESLRKAIMDGKLKPGERIVENSYASKMNISRTPVREAIRKLENEGLVQYIPRKGVVVNEFSLDDITEIYAIRKALEVLSMRYVVKRISEDEKERLKELVDEMEKADDENDVEKVIDVCKDFNELLLYASKMPRLIHLVNNMQEYLERFRRASMTKGSRRGCAIREHRQILDAVLERDVKRAEELAYIHLQRSEDAYINTV